MKKTILTAHLIILSIILSAQITITQDDVLIVGSKIEMFFDTSGTALNLGSTGSGQAWDFSSLTSSAQFNSDIISPVGTIGEAYFPTATATIKRLGINTQYYENTATEMIFLGTVVTLLDTFVTHFNYKNFVYPSVLGTTFKDTSDRTQGFTVPLGFDPDGPGPHPLVDSTARFQFSYFESTIDAEGTLKTPEAEYNVLRQSYTEIDVDSSYMFANGQWQPISATLSALLMMPPVTIDTAHAFAWITKGKSLPVMTVEYNPLTNDVGIAQWMKDTTTTPSGIQNLDPLSVQVYPNPSQEILIIETELQDGRIELYNIKGQLLHSKRVTGNQMRLSVSNLTNGTYALAIFNNLGELVSRHQVQVSK